MVSKEQVKLLPQFPHLLILWMSRSGEKGEDRDDGQVHVATRAAAAGGSRTDQHGDHQQNGRTKSGQPPSPPLDLMVRFLRLT